MPRDGGRKEGIEMKKEESKWMIRKQEGRMDVWRRRWKEEGEGKE